MGDVGDGALVVDSVALGGGPLLGPLRGEFALLPLGFLVSPLFHAGELLLPFLRRSS
jgi:hypothetical protein